MWLAAYSPLVSVSLTPISRLFFLFLLLLFFFQIKVETKSINGYPKEEIADAAAAYGAASLIIGSRGLNNIQR